MLTLKVINDNPEEVIRRLSKKHFDAKDIVTEIIASDEVRRSTQTSLDTILGEINSLSKSIGSLIKEGKKEEWRKETDWKQKQNRKQKDNRRVKYVNEAISNEICANFQKRNLNNG